MTKKLSAQSRIHVNNRSSISHLFLSSALDHQPAKQKLNIISITPAFLFAFPGDGRTGQYAESSRETGAATPAMEMEGRTCPRGQAVAASASGIRSLSWPSGCDAAVWRLFLSASSSKPSRIKANFCILPVGDKLDIEAVFKYFLCGYVCN